MSNYYCELITCGFNLDFLIELALKTFKEECNNTPILAYFVFRMEDLEYT